LLFEVHRRRRDIARRGDIARARQAFFAKPQACLRTSPLAKQYGWGLHHDGDGRVALYGVETGEYRRLASGGASRVIAAVRSRKE
jgi:hypothetical protein